MTLPRMYRGLFAMVLSRIDAETAHRLGFAAIRAVGAVPGAARLVGRLLGPRDPALRVHAFGLDLPGPFGLAAGFDKDAVGIDGLAALGFGFVEVGTVTAQPQPGNPRPRLYRLTEDDALINRMGFNNDGAATVAARLRRRHGRHGRLPVVVGVNIGKSKVAPQGEAVADYVASTEQLAPMADYLVVNVSSPNTPGLRNLQAVEHLRPLLTAVRTTADRVAHRQVPLLVKIAPDLTDGDVLAVADLALELHLDGIIATNTTLDRGGLRTPAARLTEVGAGGLSGAPLRDRSRQVLELLRERVGDRLLIISVGGIDSADEAWERIRAGATLVQAYTAFIYQGPLWPRRVHRGIAAQLRRGGYRSLREAVGSATSGEEASA